MCYKTKSNQTKPNPVYTYILNNMICEHILLITFLNEFELISFGIQLNGFKYFYLTWIILFTINYFLYMIVIVVEMDTVRRVQILDDADFISHFH